jgi:hypothetical protein
LGGGKRLFPEGKRMNLKLLESQALPAGIVFQRYQQIDKQKQKYKGNHDGFINDKAALRTGVLGR